jgi:hypothetical protein
MKRDNAAGLVAHSTLAEVVKPTLVLMKKAMKRGKKKLVNFVVGNGLKAAPESWTSRMDIRNASS